MTSIKQRIIQALKMSDGSTVKPYEPYPKEWEGLVSAEKLKIQRFDTLDLPTKWGSMKWIDEIEDAMLYGGFRASVLRRSLFGDAFSCQYQLENDDYACSVWWNRTRLCERQDVRDYCDRYNAGYRDPKCFLPKVLELNVRFHEAVCSNDVTRAYILDKHIGGLTHDQVFGIGTGRFHHDSVYCGPERTLVYIEL